MHEGRPVCLYTERKKMRKTGNEKRNAGERQREEEAERQKGKVMVVRGRWHTR